MSCPHGKIEGIPTLAVTQVDVGAVLEQQGDEVFISHTRSVVKRRPPLLIAGVDLGRAVLEEGGRHVTVP